MGDKPIRAGDVGEYLLGDLDAWKDPALKGAFLPVRQYGALEHRNTCFLCGRRGSGKSAIAIMSRDFDSWDVVEVIEGERQQYGAYIDLTYSLRKRVPDADVKRFSEILWRYALRLLIAKTMVENASKLELSDEDALTGVKELLEAKGYLNVELGTILHQVFDEAMRAIAPGDSDLVAAMSQLQSNSNIPALRTFLDKLPQLLPSKRILIILDTLESYRTHELEIRDAFKGILSAVNGAMAEDRLHQVGLRLFIPAEIFEDVSREIPAKADSNTMFLRWQSGDLFAMLARRYLNMLKRTSSIGDSEASALGKIVANGYAASYDDQDVAQHGRRVRDEFWYGEGFLPEKLVNVRGEEEDCFAYILRHTQRRPRELIWILNQIIRKAITSDARTFPRLSAEAVVNGIHDHGTLITMLRDTLSPFDGYVDEIVDRARTVFYEKPRVMSGSELGNFAEALYDVGPVPDLMPEDFIRYLLRAGLIGLIPDFAGSKDGPYTVGLFEYLMQDHIAFNKTLHYYVHPMLGDAFGMSRSIEFPPVYPLPEEDTWLEEHLGVPLRR